MSKEENHQLFYTCACSQCRQQPAGPVAQQHRAINRLLTVADERARRLVAGFLARQYGRGGIAWLARISGLSRNTIRCGLRELAEPDDPAPGRIRRPGGGRKRLEKKARTC